MVKEWRTGKLGEFVAFNTGKLDSNAAVPDGDYPFFTCSQETLRTNTFSFDTECVLLAGNNANGIYPLKYFHGKFDAYQRTYVVKPRDTEVLTTKFLYYALRPKLSELRSFSTGAATKFLTLTILNETEIQIPSLPVQRRIAGILSAYDDLIENNQRRIKILEEMARLLYREWFVHFRFPGHEKFPLVDSPLGPIPKGWEIAKLQDITTKIGSGATPRGGKGAYKSEGIRLIRSLNIYDYWFELSDLAFIDEIQAAQLDGVTVKPCDVLLNITGASVGRCCMVPSYLLPARVNQHVAIVRTNVRRGDPYYLLDTINNEQNKHKLLGLAQGGATREALTKETICRFPIQIPPCDLLAHFGSTAGALHRQREVLARLIQNLRRTRDMLLPRLLSGGSVLPHLSTGFEAA